MITRPNDPKSRQRKTLIITSLLLRRFRKPIARMYKVWRGIRKITTEGVVGVIFDDHGAVLVVEHAFHPTTPWGLPGGWVRTNEDPRDTLIRELQEELSLEVEISDLFFTELTGTNHRDYAFIGFAKSKIGRLNYEILDYRWFTPSTLPHLSRIHAQLINRAYIIVQSRNSPYDKLQE